MRHLLAGLGLVLVVSGCCCDLKKESYAAVPLTLDDARKQAKESGAEISVERRTRQAGGGGCGHSAVCVILLPLILYDVVFPETWDEATVTKDGEVVLFAAYEKSGALIHAQHVKDGVVLETRNIELKALGKKVYVDSAKLLALPDGGSERVLLPLASQHDFIAEERKALAGTKDPARRAEYIWEAARLLEAEGLAFARERLLAADEPERSRADVVRRGCASPTAFAPLLETAKQSPGAWVKLALVECSEAQSAEREAALAIAVRAACEAPLDAELLGAFDPRDMRGEAAVAAAGACPAGAQRALFQLWLSHPVATADLDALLAREDTAKLAWKWLDPSQDNQRAAMVKAIAADTDGASTLLGSLQKSQAVLEPALLEALAQRFVRRTGLLQIGDRHSTLELFALAAAQPDGKARTTSARAVVAAAAASEKDAKHKAMLAAVLVTLGDQTRVRAAMAGVGQPIYAGDSPSLDEDVCAWALLKHGGCEATGKVLSCP